MNLFFLCNLWILSYYRGSEDGYYCCFFPKKQYFAATHQVTLEPHLQGHLMKSVLLPPFVPFIQSCVIARKYNIATCLIEKVISTFQFTLFCYLNKPWLFGRGKKSLNDGRWYDRPCTNGTNFLRISQKGALRSLGRDSVFFLVTRNPLQRFVSGFMHLCIYGKNRHSRCWECGGDLACFLPKLRNLLFSYSKDPKKMFLGEDLFRVAHFGPMTWHCCSPTSLKFVRMIRYDMLHREEMAKNYDHVLQIAGVPMLQRSYIGSEFVRILPPHSTWNKANRVDIENKLLSNNSLFEIFLQLFYYDFAIFGYDFPKPRYTE
ncbi:hypothetical protein RB195_017074 [Necator americanus]